MAGRDPGPPVAGSIALAFSVLISETASAPPSSAATATAAGSATFGVSFTISGFSVSGRSASSSAAVSSGCSPTIRPEWTLGQETLSSIAATSSRAADRRRPGARTPRGWSPSPRRSAAPAARASCGRSSARNPSRPLLGSPIELIIPAGVSQIRCGSFPARGSERDRLRDEGRERKLLEQRVAVDPPRRDRVERARGVDDRVLSSIRRTRRPGPRVRSPRGSPLRGWSLARSDPRSRRCGFPRGPADPRATRAVDAEADVAAAAGGDGAAEAGAVAAGHRRLMASSQATPRSAHSAAHRIEHRRRAAGVDGGAGGVVALEHRRQQVGDVAGVAGVAVLAGEADLAAGEEVVEAAGVGLGRGSRAGRGSGRRARRSAGAGARAGRCRCRRRPGSRPAAPGASSRGVGEGVAERAVDPDPLARLELAEPLGAGADPLDQEVEAHGRRPPRPASATESARGRNGRCAALLPVALGGEHVELAAAVPAPPSRSEKTR